jgi:hypothetical protein
MHDPQNNLDLPLGRIELLGQVLHLIEHDGELVIACADETNSVIVASAAPRVSAANCRRLMREAIDLLLESAEAGLRTNGSELRPNSAEASLLVP